MKDFKQFINEDNIDPIIEQYKNTIESMWIYIKDKFNKKMPYYINDRKSLDVYGPGDNDEFYLSFKFNNPLYSKQDLNPEEYIEKSEKAITIIKLLQEILINDLKLNDFEISSNNASAMENRIIIDHKNIYFKDNKNLLSSLNTVKKYKL